jgi:hypothetical protein
MTPETRAFLDAVRTADNPSAEDERRVLSAVRTAVAASAGAGAAVGLSKAKALVGGGAASSFKLGGLVLGLSAAAWFSSQAVSRDRPARNTATSSAASATWAPARPAGSTSPPAPLSEATPPTAAPSAGTRPTPAPGPRAPATIDTAAPALPNLRDEITLLTEVQAALDRGDGATALRHLDRQAPVDGRLLAERRAARIFALCLLGRTEEAAQSARVFFRAHSTSVQKAAVERSCATKASDPR